MKPASTRLKTSSRGQRKKKVEPVDKEAKLAQKRKEREERREARQAKRREIQEETVQSLFPELGEFIEAFTECDERLFDLIIEQMAEGQVFARLCHEFGIRKNIVQKFIRLSPERQIKYDNARKMQAEAWTDDLLALADNATDETIQTVRVQIDTRRWLMGKNHSRFSDKSTIAMEGGDPEKPIQHRVKPEMTDAESAAAYNETRRLIKGLDAG